MQIVNGNYKKKIITVKIRSKPVKVEKLSIWAKIKRYYYGDN